MAKKLSHVACFEAFGTKPKNTRWSWSGRAEDGSVVSVTLWQDQFRNGGRTYTNADHDLSEWRRRPGLVELIDNLEHAATHLDGVVRVILAEPKDPHARPRSIKRCWPQPNLVMRVTALDADEGTFTLERVEI